MFYFISTYRIPALNKTRYIVFCRHEGVDIEYGIFETRELAEKVIAAIVRANQGLPV